MTGPIEIDVVIYRSGEFWIAQGLQYDITAQARLADFARLPERFVKMAAMEIAASIDLGEQPLASVPEAPVEFWKLHKSASITLSLDTEALRIRGAEPSTQRIAARMKLAGETTSVPVEA